jgi:hypothetical protein
VVESLPAWAPQDVDLSVASAARVYDYYLGGAHNFSVDRELAQKVLEIFPATPKVAQANRAFLHRAVRYLSGQGIQQFIDIGSGIPTVSNVHETAQTENPNSRVLYVDHDPVAVAHSELILDGNQTTRVLQADLRRPQDILKAPQLAELIDLSQPVAVLMVAVLHFVSDDEHPTQIINQFRDAIIPGSYLVISHVTPAGRTSQDQRVKEIYRAATDLVTSRSRSGIEELFTGWELVPPGLVWVPEWRPNWPDEVGPEPSTSFILGGVARKT